MRKKLIILLSTIIMAFMPVLAQSAVPEAVATPELWVWKFDVTTIYPNPCYSGDVYVKVSLLALDTDANIYDIHVTSKVFDITGRLVHSTDHGLLPSKPSHTLQVIPDTQGYHGSYIVHVTGSNQTFGRSETEQKTLSIY